MRGWKYSPTQASPLRRSTNLRSGAISKSRLFAFASNLCSQPGPVTRPPSFPTMIFTVDRGTDTQVAPSSSAPAVGWGSIATHAAAQSNVVVFMGVASMRQCPAPVARLILKSRLPHCKGEGRRSWWGADLQHLLRGARRKGDRSCARWSPTLQPLTSRRRCPSCRPRSGQGSGRRTRRCPSW